MWSIEVEFERISRAKQLTLQYIRPSTGRCPWRIQYDADGLRVASFVRLPAEISIGSDDSYTSFIAAPILCDLAAEVRAERVVVEQVLAPDFREVFFDAVPALMAEQDAQWQRSGFLSPPTLEATFAKRDRSKGSLDQNTVVLGFSGGKDSIVSLFALLEAGYRVVPVLLNEGDRTWQDLRTWIPKLTSLGLRPLTGFVSVGRRKDLREHFGQWYFSSYQIGWLVAFLMLCAIDLEAGVVCLGIEASADLSWRSYRGRSINHQHQKTTSHLRLLERFYRRTLHSAIRIGSPIAELTDADVISVLMKVVPDEYRHFSSCGGSNGKRKHCGHCGKCAFVYALLSASPSGHNLAEKLFNNNPLNDVEVYRPWLDSRRRLPLGCLGQREEVWTAFECLLKMGSTSDVVQYWRRSNLRRRLGPDRIRKTAPSSSPLVTAVKRAGSLVHEWAR